MRAGPGGDKNSNRPNLHSITFLQAAQLSLSSSSAQNGSMSSSVHSNGYLEGNSPNSSQLSSEGGGGGNGDATLISRTQKQHTTQQVRAEEGGPWVDRVSSEERVAIAASHTYILDYMLYRVTAQD